MREIIYYTTAMGNSEVKDFIEALDEEALKKKLRPKSDLEKITYAMDRVAEGEGQPHMDTLREKVNEIRAGRFRITYFEWRGRLVLLTYFRKTTNKTPDHEIERAIKRKKDWLKRNGN